jgi:biopolymer transport protein ExbD
MRIPIEKRIRTTRLAMTSMIDVVFLLISFFMIVTEISRQDDLAGLQLPHVVVSKAIDELGNLVVCIASDGTLVVGGEPVTQPQLTDILAVHARNHPGKAAVLIKADRRVEYRHVREVIRACAEHSIRIWRLSFGALPVEM